MRGSCVVDRFDSLTDAPSILPIHSLLIFNSPARQVTAVIRGILKLRQMATSVRESVMVYYRPSLDLEARFKRA